MKLFLCYETLPFKDFLPNTFKVEKDFKLNFIQERGPVITNQNGKLNLKNVTKWVDKPSLKWPAHMLSSTNVALYLDNLPLGWLVQSGNKSFYADAVVRIGNKSVIEIQAKATKARITQKVLLAEIAKSVVNLCPDAGYKSCLLILSASGPNPGLKIPEYDNLLIIVPTVEQMREFIGNDLLTQFQK
jgi:hypothetical protein